MVCTFKNQLLGYFYDGMVVISMKFSNLFTTQVTEEALTIHCGVSLEIIHTSK